MTEKQVAALRRILQREAKEYRTQVGRPVPGQHQSGGKVAISDGTICVLLQDFQPELPIGEQVDSFAKIIRDECICGLHLPVAEDQICIPKWKKLARKLGETTDFLSIGIPVAECTLQVSLDSVNIGPFSSAEGEKKIAAEFYPQLLIDAVEAVGGDIEMFLGFGPFNGHFPSLLVLPAQDRKRTAGNPIALVFPLKH